MPQQFGTRLEKPVSHRAPQPRSVSLTNTLRTQTTDSLRNSRSTNAAAAILVGGLYAADVSATSRLDYGLTLWKRFVIVDNQYNLITVSTSFTRP